MKKVAIDDVEHPRTTSPPSVRPLEGPLGTTDVAINYYELAPGETFGFDYHRHLDQEEVFVVQTGTVTFRTEADDIEVAAGEAVRFAPGEFQLGRNDGPERVRAIAIGAPRETTEIEYLRACPDCGEDTIQTLDVKRDEGAFGIRCETCGTVVERIKP